MVRTDGTNGGKGFAVYSAADWTLLDHLECALATTLNLLKFAKDEAYAQTLTERADKLRQEITEAKANE